MAIPKLIHSLWYQGADQAPLKYHENIRSVIDKNPDWTYKLWDKNSIDELMLTVPESWRKKYNSFKILHQKIDFARYVILYVNGGVSVDMDCEAIKPFDTLTALYEPEPQLIVSKNSTGAFINNATIFSTDNNPLLAKFIDGIETSCFALDKSLCVMKTTGTTAFTKFINDNKSQIIILDNKYFEPCSGSNSDCTLPPEAILNHKHEKSWVNPLYISLEKLYYAAKRNIAVLLLLLLVIIFIVLIPKK